MRYSINELFWRIVCFYWKEDHIPEWPLVARANFNFKWTFIFWQTYITCPMLWVAGLVGMMISGTPTQFLISAIDLIAGIVIFRVLRSSFDLKAMGEREKAKYPNARGLYTKAEWEEYQRTKTK